MADGFIESPGREGGWSRSPNGWISYPSTRCDRRPLSARCLLPVIMLAVALAVIACGNDTNQVTLAELAQDQERFRGESIATCGLVRNFEERGNSYYVLEDEADNRVGVTPGSEVAAFVGRRLCVIGTFDVEPEFGRVIQVESVERAEREP